MNKDRICGSCHACCDGWLEGEAYGIKFGNNKPCSFFCKGKCTIYPVRPKVCKNYYCAWVQGLFSDSLKPDESGFLVSVQDWSRGQFFLIIEIDENSKSECLEEIFEFCKETNTPYLIRSLKNKESHSFGPEEFLAEQRL
jgi:Fe-S-cluster containining protein